MIHMLSLAVRKRYRAVGAMAFGAVVGGCSLDTTPEGLSVLAIISGSQQTVKVGAQAAQPLVVRAFDVNGLGMPGLNVDWDIATNAGTVSSSRTVTDDTGTTQVNYTAPSTAGNAQIRATTGGLTVTFNLIVEPLSGT